MNSPAHVAITVALQHYGSLNALARVIDITPQGLGKRRREGRGLSAEECFLVHQDAGIPLSRLRPDIWGIASD